MLNTHQYGQTFEQIKKVTTPTASAQPWGQFMLCANREEYSLARFDLKAHASKPLSFLMRSWVTYYVEQGRVQVRKIEKNGAQVNVILEKGGVIHLSESVPHGFFASEPTIIYGFALHNAFNSTYALEEQASRVSENAAVVKGEATLDFREKYWGTIETIVSQEVAGKRILILAGKQSSMEFHVKKTEAYYIHSGEVKVGLRVGRGENKSLILKEGDLFEVFPGTMHMRIGVKDTVIIEVSTPDDDGDSHLVEDGMTYKHIERA
jgi:mannose-6-phosphate isomerase-like protein (cupin superfamily)